jgi:hypothetical protein
MSEEIPQRPELDWDEFISLLHALRVTVTGLRLPNHVHGIIVIKDEPKRHKRNMVGM